MSGISGHERTIRGATNVWLTPPDIIEKLGPFHLDPCAAIDQPWRTATVQYTEEDDGLSMPWQGRVWLNPPYGPEAGIWMNRLADHGNGIALIFARTDTVWFQRIATRADSILFVAGRLVFRKPDGTRGKTNAGGPSCFLAFGMSNVAALAQSNLPGFFARPIAA